MKKKKVILCDQDGVLLGKDYSCNYDFAGLKKLLSENNAILVPHSDTPTLRLKSNFESATGLEITNLISERGAIIIMNNREVYRLHYPEEAIKIYRRKLFSLAQKFTPFIYSGDSVSWVKKGKAFAQNQKVIIFDSFRQSSLAYYARRTDSEGLAQIDDDFYREFTKEAKKIPLPVFFNVEEYNPDYGIAILSSSQATKTSGFLNYLRLAGQEDCEYYMIGDYLTDIINHPRMTLLAVSNCVEELRDQASFVSKFPLAKGMMDCINYALSV